MRGGGGGGGCGGGGRGPEGGEGLARNLVNRSAELTDYPGWFGGCIISGIFRRLILRPPPHVGVAPVPGGPAQRTRPGLRARPLVVVMEQLHGAPNANALWICARMRDDRVLHVYYDFDFHESWSRFGRPEGPLGAGMALFADITAAQPRGSIVIDGPDMGLCGGVALRSLRFIRLPTH